jgi:hemolysin D
MRGLGGAMQRKYSGLRLVPAESGLRKEECEFLPAALEILETPPSPAGRTLVLTLCLIAMIAVVWACFGHLDIVAVAPGKIVAHMRTKLVQPFETSTVRAILVGPGQKVRAGEALIELDPTAAIAERDKARKDLDAARLDQARLEAFLDGATAPTTTDLENMDPVEVRRAQTHLTAQRAERDAKLATIVDERAQRVAERQALQQTLAKLEQVLPLVAQRADIRRLAAATQFGSRLLSLETQQQLVETQSELDIDRSKMASLDAAIEGLDQKLAGADAEIMTAALTELDHARERARNAAEALAKANHRVELQTLRSPIDGSVQQLQVTTIGSVVTPAQQLLSVVPDQDRLEVDAVLENRDVGFVAAGQPVQLKIDTYPFTRYGLAKGTVLSVDRDAEATPVNQAVQGSLRTADEIDNVESSERLRYTVHISLEPGSLEVDGRPAALLPGMSVKAEIVTGERRIIEYLLAPLTLYAHDSMKER